MNRKIIFPLILFAVLVHPVWAATYYMRADGTAADKASATGPCDNTAAAMPVSTHNRQSFSGGDKICLCDDGGDYRSSIIAPSSGTDDHPIIYTNAPGDAPTVDLSVGISNTGWKDAGGGRYKKSGYGRLFFEDDIALEAATSKRCADGNWYYKIGSRTLWYKPTRGTPDDHKIETLWFDDLRSARGVDLSNKSNITVTGLCFDRCGVGIYFGQNLAFPVSPMVNISLHNNRFNRVHWAMLSHITGGIESNVKITNNFLSNVSCGISAWTHSDETPGHTQHHSGYKITGNKIFNLNAISRSLLWTQAWKPGYAVDHEGISFQDVQDSVISGNQITTAVTDTRDRLRAIYLFVTSGGRVPTAGNTISGNEISGVYWPAIYISAALKNAGFKNNTIAYNVIRAVSANDEKGAFKINTYSGNNPLTGANYFVNNVIDNHNGGWAIASESGPGGNGAWLIRNNIVKSAVNIQMGLSSAPGFTIDHNIYVNDGRWRIGDQSLTFAEWRSKTDFDRVGSMIADPFFISSSDFHLQAVSPAIDAGIDVGLEKDCDGNPVPSGPAVDIGAYEYVK